MPTPTLNHGSIDRQTPRSSTAPKLVLEPVRASSQLESYPLAVGRYLIGAAPDCDIVIDVGGVAPQHCLMIVGANKTIVKAISPLTWINDGPLTEAVLKLGERLILGPVELRTRRPEVSEWIERREGVAAPVAFQPPQIEVLLDQALQQLQSAIDDSPGPPASWSEDLPLQEAVQIHATIAEQAAPRQLPEASVERTPALELMAEQRRALDQRELEIGERSRTIEYFSTELSTREVQLRSREQGLDTLEAQIKQVLNEVSQREQALTAREQALLERNESEAQASRMLAEMTRSLLDEQARLRQLEDALQEQVSQLEQQAQALAERSHSLEIQESALATPAERLQQQAPSVQSLAALGPIDTSHVELREAAVAKREAILVTSTAALQATREQLSLEAAELEQRFETLLQRDQEIHLKQSVSREQASQAAASARVAATELAGLAEREQTVANSLVKLADGEATLQKLKAELDRRDRDLRGLRSELDIREEALNQQFSQLQLDRSALRATQSKLQLAEQAANQRLVDQGSSEQVAELAEQRARLDQDRAEYLRERQTLESWRLQIEEQRRQLEQEQSDRALLSASEVNQFEIDNEWQKLAAERARLVSERRDLDQARATLHAEPEPVCEPKDESNEVSEQLLALVSERQSLSELREKLLRKQQALHTERDEIRQTRNQFDQDYQQLLTIKAESVSERDTYILERQAVISERQSLQDRERHVKQAETEIGQHRQQAEQVRTEVESGRKQMTTQRVHLEEEWASLRQELAELKRAESELDVQREELTHLAQQLTDLGAGGEATKPDLVLTVPPSPPPVPMMRSVERPLTPAFDPPASVDSLSSEDALSAASEQDSDDEALDPLAGFASFSSIGSTIDDELPPEIAEIMRKAGVPSPAWDNPPHDKSYSPTVTAPFPPAPPQREPQNPSIDAREEQRLRDLLGRSSESYVDAASVRNDDELDTYEVVEDEVFSQEETAWPEDSGYEVIESPAENISETELAPENQAPAPPAEPKASELRSRLSEMFGIDLGRLRQPAAPKPDDIEPPPMESPLDQSPSEYSSDREDTETETQALHSPAEDIEEEPAPAAIDESLDPVAAYMEQLLARTRSSKNGHAAKTESSAPKPAPPPVIPQVLQKQPEVQRGEEPAPVPARQPPRKLEAAEKQAIRANLDSFREIANTQARSDVARSELRRLKITEKVKQLFLAISGGIALILVTTELWTTRRYRLEMGAALIATAILGYDYFRTQKRLRELESIAPLESEADEDEGGEA